MATITVMATMVATGGDGVPTITIRTIPIITPHTALSMGIGMDRTVIRTTGIMVRIRTRRIQTRTVTGITGTISNIS